ncbi:hypothetical protein [Streptomyces mirabilis]|uniref:hypothetical protein n=1 Tax=Streptomyces mirabilis TaxID=68239 RepID=UPI0033AF9C21
MTRLPTATELPKPGAVHPTQAPAATDAQGFDVKRSKELKGRRKERQRTYLNPDGGYTTRFYTEPVNFRAKDGSWKSIDTTLVRQNTSGPRTMSVSEPGWETRSTESALQFAMPDGSPGISFSQPVPNSIYSPRKGMKNLGTVMDSRTGVAVPTGSMP